MAILVRDPKIMYQHYTGQRFIDIVLVICLVLFCDYTLLISFLAYLYHFSLFSLQ